MAGMKNSSIIIILSFLSLLNRTQELKNLSQILISTNVLHIVSVNVYFLHQFSMVFIHCSFATHILNRYKSEQKVSWAINFICTQNPLQSEWKKEIDGRIFHPCHYLGPTFNWISRSKNQQSHPNESFLPFYFFCPYYRKILKWSLYKGKVHLNSTVLSTEALLKRSNQNAKVQPIKSQLKYSQ